MLEVLADDIGMDRGAVHEISHHLWDALGGEISKISYDKNPRLSMMKEGYASYCELTWFADLYPLKKELNYSCYWGVPDYIAGGLRMLSFVHKYGEDIMLEVPKRWRELDKKTPMSEPEMLVSSAEQIDAFKGKIEYSD